MDRKISWGFLSVEITRRCNLHCAHCMRGDAQDKDMDEETMIALLDKTMEIDKLFYTGGEPFLNVAGMMRFLDLLRDRDIPLYFLEIITNGTINNDSVIAIIKAYSEYIAQSIKSDKDYRADLQSRISISVSFDRYHHTDSESHFNWFVANLGNIAQIHRRRVGDYPAYYGNAKNLPYAEFLTNANIMNHICNQSKICTFTSDSKDFPCAYKNICNPEIDEIIIPCRVNISYSGDVFARIFDYEYAEVESNSICSVFVDSANDILSSIYSYNQGRPYCKVANTTNAEIIHMNYNSANIQRNNLELAYRQSQENGDSVLRQIANNWLHVAARSNKPIAEIDKKMKALDVSVSEEYINECKTTYPSSVVLIAKNDIIPDDELLSMQLALSTQHERYSTVINANPSLTEEQKETIDLLMQAYDSAKALCELNPNDKYYSELLQRDEKRLMDYGKEILQPYINKYFTQALLSETRNAIANIKEKLKK